jgi:RNA:NAD 2'-phosphotransferase (TPT1/KptA family)
LHTFDKTQTKLFRHPEHGPLPEEVYHGSFRAEPEAVFEQGLKSIHDSSLTPDHPDEIDEALRQYLMSRDALEHYVNRNDLEYRGRQFVGTSKAPLFAYQRAVSSRHREGFVYSIDLRKMARDGHHISDVNKKAGVTAQWEHEIAVLHRVPPRYIIGARKVSLQCVHLQGPNTVEVDSTFIPNPNYVKDEDE